MRYQNIKTIIDFLVSFFMLLIFLPIFVLIFFSIFIINFKNPIYVSERIGLNKKIFKIYKFRTLVKKDYQLVQKNTNLNKDKTILFGNFLRKTKLDELPQLINVFNGSMSLIGPRPILIKSDLEIEKNLEILSVKPGLIDLSTIYYLDQDKFIKKFSDNSEKMSKFFQTKNFLRNIYLENISFELDLKIIFLGVVSIFNLNYVKKIIDNDYLKK